MKVLTFISGNVNKVVEVGKLLTDVPNLQIVSKDLDLPEYQEEMIEISNLKARHGYGLLKKPMFVEDTSLCFSALNGMPGPYIKWFIKGDENNKLERLKGLRKMLIGFDNFEAEAVTVISFYDPSFHDEPISFVGTCAGRIVDPRGPLTFGWDPCFEPLSQENSDKPLTYSEMDISEKNKVSHRSMAFKKFRDFLTTKYCR